MTKVQRYKNRVEMFLQGDGGARFFNFAYSIGAAIVIWGALFKILHLPGGNLLLAIGMGTEVLMFILNAFDRPAKQPNWEKIFPALAEREPGQVTTSGEINVVTPEVRVMNMSGAVHTAQAGMAPDGTMHYNQPQAHNMTRAELPEVKEMNDAAGRYVEQMDHIVDELATLRAETEKMSQNIATLNAIYAGMIQAMAGNVAVQAAANTRINNNKANEE